MKKFLALLLVTVLLLAGCSVSPKTFTTAGVSLTLDSSFIDFTNSKQNTEQYPFLYANNKIGILGVQENKAELAVDFGEHTTESYAELISDLYELNATVQHKDGFCYYNYNATIDGESYTYLCIFMDAGADFWNLQGYCLAADYAEYQETIWNFLTSAVFA